MDNQHDMNKLTKVSRFQITLLIVSIQMVFGCSVGSLMAKPTATPSPTVAIKGSVDAVKSEDQAAAGEPAPQANATQTTTAVWGGGEVPSGTQKVLTWFDPEDCACAAFPGIAEPRYGPGVLECTYTWGGKYIDDNILTFSIEQYEDTVDLEGDFNEHISWSYDSAQDDKDFITSGSMKDHEQFIVRNESNGFVYVTTGPGGGSSKTGGEIPMCGNGSGVLRVDDYLIELRMFACDLSEDRLVYETTMETLEGCTIASIERAKARTP